MSLEAANKVRQITSLETLLAKQNRIIAQQSRQLSYAKNRLQRFIDAAESDSVVIEVNREVALLSGKLRTFKSKRGVTARKLKELKGE